MPQLELFSYRRCPFAIRVRMTLHEKNIPFVLHEEQIGDFSERLKKLHPNPAVPLLLDGDFVIYESALINEYLNEKWPEPALLPENAREKAKARLMTHWCDNLLKPQIDRFKYGSRRFSEIEATEAPEKIKQLLQELESKLENKDWLIGNQLSLADIHLFPFFRQIVRCNPAYPYLSLFPNLNLWLKRITDRETFKKTMLKD